jgi:hypothetical protein
MIYLTTDEVIQLHEWIIQQTGGGAGIIDRGLIDSAVYQPQATFGGHDLCPTLADKQRRSRLRWRSIMDLLTATSASRTRQWKHSW